MKSEQGIAMVMVVMVVVILLAIAGSGLMLSGLNLKSSSNLKTGTGALQAADGALNHSLAVIAPSADFDNLIQGLDASFPLVSGSPTLSGALGGYTYTVVAVNDVTVPLETATDDINGVAQLLATANGPNGARRTIRGYIRVNNLFRNIKGAVSARDGTDAAQPTEIEDLEPATGSRIDGMDCNPPSNGGGAGPGPHLTGIATESANGKSNIDTDLLNHSATTAVTGINGSGDVTNPSGWMAQADFDAWVSSLIAQSIPAGTGDCGISNGTGGLKLGTWSNPQICHASAAGGAGGDLASLIPSGSSGAGILIINDLDPDASTFSSELNNFTYEGIVIVVGDGRFRLQGTSRIYGALVQDNVTGSHSGETRLRLRDDSQICYSTVATGLIVPTAELIAWNEVMQ